MAWWKRSDAEPAATPAAAEAEIRKAYERGRRDERARHRSHPFLAMMVFMVALAGAGMMYLAAREGSFSRGGEVVDLKLANATDNALASSATSPSPQTGDTQLQR